MSIRYSHLLSPVQVGNVLFKNRMEATAATPHFVQGTEPYPTEKWITMMANRAKNGAAGVYINHLEHGSPAKAGIDFTPAHFSIMDIDNTSTHNYLCQMIDAIRYYGSIPITGPNATFTRTEEQGMGPQAMMMAEGDKKDGPGGPGGPGGGPGAGGPGGMPDMFGGPFEETVPAVKKSPIQILNPGPSIADTFTKAQMHEYIDTAVASAKELKALGFQMFSFHNAYRGGPGAQFWSPLTNHRHDEYGVDTVENRTRFLIEFLDAMKQTLGKDFPLEVLISGTEPGGATIADTVELARLLEGHCDILSIRNGVQDPQHPTGFTSTRATRWPNEAVTTAVTQDCHRRGAKLLIGATAGLHDADLCESVIANEQADLVCMARSWICDSEYGKKLYEGRGEDITPCVRCNKCHVPNDTDKFRSFCSVNPLIGLEDKIDRMIAPVEKEKKVAVVGGGPAGMYAAMTLRDRGHQVTLYEKEAQLGGQLIHADFASFKWPLQDFKDFLARQCYKKGVDIKLNTEATKEMLAQEHYDHVIVAIGPVFTKANIPGAESPKVLTCMDVFGHEDELPHNIVVIGGSETGVETAMDLAEKGHKVTVLCRQKSLASDAPHAHYVTMLEDAWLKLDNFYWVKGIQKYQSIDDTGVNYVNFEGKEKRIDCDCVIMCTGARPNTEGCQALYGAADRTDFVGDCFRVGNVHFAVTTAFGAANQI